ncbi:MAG: 2-succinyl-5-enolpyruvyl-6-hydroxy-3-cyclohexene-1-carboxylic-acid synthase [Halobacteriales archaeon]
MTAPNVNTYWGSVIAEELDEAGVSAVCIAPGSRSTPLAVAFHDHPDVRVFSHLDERSAAYFALGRARRTGEPTPLVCTSGTAAANFHPAVVEASNARVPMLLLTADRPPELQESGANQTIDQEKLYGDGVRWYRTLPEPRAEPRRIRSLRTTVARAVGESTGQPPGPVHLNCPFAKPLEPTEVPGDVPESFPTEHPRAASGREGPYVSLHRGRPTLDEAALTPVVEAVAAADRGLIVAGPANAPTPGPDDLAALASATRFPVLADPLSGARFGSHVPEILACGGYDAYLDARITESWPDPDVVLRFGASPTSKTLRQYLDRADPRQFLVDPAGEWREATFATTDLIEADPSWLAGTLADGIGGVERDIGPDPAWVDRFRAAERAYWDLLGNADIPREGGVLATVAANAPDPATLFVSNSMPVRDLDRFGEPDSADLRILGNRGASGIDGITSTALGAGSATDDPLILVTGDLAYYHDMNGLLALGRCNVDATIVEINNDGGGIFHMLPIEEFEPFESQFKTPHGLDFAPTEGLYDLAFRREHSIDGVEAALADALESEGSHVIEVMSDAESNHRRREELQESVVGELDAV